MKFTCIGFDVRKWPWNECYAGENDWERSEENYIALMNEFSLNENSYQLLDITEQEQLLRVEEYISKKEICNLVAIEFSDNVVKMLDVKYGLKTDSNKINLSNFTCYGFDVCDVNGFFTALHNDQLGREGCGLFLESELINALELAQLANVFDKNHYPFVVAKVYALSPRSSD